jgi:hypothetical protein
MKKSDDGIETPNNWIIVRFDSEEYGIIYKVVAGWSGGYVHGDSWRINSGIVSVDEDEKYYYFYGYSGSIYKCYKESNAFRMNIAPAVGIIKEQGGYSVDVEEVVKYFEDKEK